MEVFVSKKYLNEDLIATDERLLKNFYLNEGFYDVKINSSLAKQVENNEFEIIYNIQPNEKIYFNDLTVNIPVDYDEKNFETLRLLFKELKGTPYSINSVNNILEEIDIIALNEEFTSVKATATESIELNKLDILFNIQETEKFLVEKINIFGNNITRESVIRNQFVLDEGDIFNEILSNRSINNLRNLNFFKKVNSEILEGSDKNSKIINIELEEKPTGEITAGAGLGTSGGTLVAGVKENNYLGKGLSVQANGTLTGDSIKGLFQVTNPNFNNTDKSVFANIQATEIDQLKKYGYKTNKAGFAFGTNFEYLNDFNLGVSTSSFYEKIETNSTASARQKKQEGDYWDTFANLSFDYDKRNQKFKTTDGFRSTYSINLPVISETNTLTNSYNYKIYGELYENNISSFSIFLKSANSITSDDVKLTERLYIPSNKLRGFENGKIGPKDGGDFIGGNFISTVNFNTTIPKLFENSESLDALLFFDMGNVWGVDYDSSINDSNKIRSSIGIGIDWFSMVGPINVSLTEVISKNSTDITESFRFNIGTTF